MNRCVFSIAIAEWLKSLTRGVVKLFGVSGIRTGFFWFKKANLFYFQALEELSV